MYGPTFSAILAHEGGWDEILLVAIPVVFIGGLLLLANRRVNQRLRDAEASSATDSTTPKP